MPALHFLTFADGSARYRGAAGRLAGQVRRAQIFGTITVFDLKRICSDFPDFYSRHIDFISSNPRGLGYFVWKPFLIFQALLTISPGDMLVYADGGCEFTGKNGDYLRDLFPPGGDLDLKAIVLQPEHSARRWTNRFCADRMQGAAQFLDLPQISATMIFFRNTPNTKAFVSEWFNLCVSDNYGLLADRDRENEDPAFVEHRHDQAIFNLLLRHRVEQGSLKCGLIPVEVASVSDFPILGLRNPTPVSRLRGNRYSRRLMLNAFDMWAFLRGL